MDLRIDLDRPASPSQQLVEEVLDAVASGRLAAGDRLPTVREAAAQAPVNPHTRRRGRGGLGAAGRAPGRRGAGGVGAGGGAGGAAGRAGGGATQPSGVAPSAPSGPAPAGTAAIEARGLVFAYGRRRVLDGLDLAVASGSTTVLLGENGAGK